jgi:hypothetical protein
LPAVAARKARETMRLCEIVGLVGYALGGLPGERLLNRLGIKSSDDTVLRRVKGRRGGARRFYMHLRPGQYAQLRRP